MRSTRRWPRISASRTTLPEPSSLQLRAASRGAALFLCACLLLLSCAPAAIAASGVSAGEARIAALQQAARRLGLAATPGWHSLLHDEPAAFGAAHSAVVSDWFFLSPRGRDDPQAELDATLSAFFDDRPRAPRDEPAQCIFGARYRWLAQQLDLVRLGPPPQRCERREAWMRSLAPQRVWVVFPSAYLNSPASMFGHTLLRLDGQEVAAGTPLLAYAVNFAAVTEQSNGLVFAVKGLTGGYRGRFGVLPYYEKVKEYARLESRDLWEYPLQLTPAQIQMLLLHLWELRGADFDYYFFTRNCSYQLLTLLQVARPDLQWGRKYAWHAIPTDTLRTLTPIAGRPVYRPSLATQLGAQAAALDGAQRTLALALADGRGGVADPALRALTAQQRAQVLSVANDVLYFRYASASGSRDALLERSQALLRARAATGRRSAFAPVMPPAVDPARGHPTQRTSAGLGVIDGHPTLALHWRPAYHDLLDDPAGYSDGQQIEFLDLALGTDLDRRHLRWSADLLDIDSVAVRDDIFKPVSWRVRVGAERAVYADARASGILEGGPGVAYGDHRRIVGYGFALAHFEVNGALDRGQTLGLGPQLGLLAHPAANWQLQFEASALLPVEGMATAQRSVVLGQQWQLYHAIALRAELRNRRIDKSDWNELGVALQYFF